MEGIRLIKGMKELYALRKEINIVKAHLAKLDELFYLHSEELA